MANGVLLNCKGQFDNVHVELQGIPFVLTLYALPLVVLMMSWGAVVGTIRYGEV